MPQSEARAWWAEVQHVRESIERRRADGDRSDAGDDRTSSPRFARSTDEPRSSAADAIDADPLTSRQPSRRFERQTHAHHAPSETDRSRGRGRRQDVREHMTGVDRRDPSRSDRRAADRAEHRDLGRAERRDPARSDRRADRHGVARAERREPGRATERRESGRAVEDRGPARAAPRADRAPAAMATPSGRRTVQITGRPSNTPRLVEVERRRPVRRPEERVGGRPDRIALWAVLLGFFLILVAASSSRAATTAPAGPAPAAAPLVAPAAPAAASNR